MLSVGLNTRLDGGPRRKLLITHIGRPVREVWLCVLDRIRRVQEIVARMLSLPRRWILEDGRVGIGG